MSLTSSTFIAFLAATVLLFHASASVAFRRGVLGLASAVFLFSYVHSWWELLPLLAFLALGYAGLHVSGRFRSGTVLALGVAFVLVVYIYLKRFSFIDGMAPLPFPYLVLGLSYILFRILHLVIDARSGGLPGRIGPLAYFRYTCNFLCFVSGPIQRYGDFARTDGIEAFPLDRDRTFRAFQRIVFGYLKLAVVGATANYVYLNLAPQFLPPTAPGLARLCILYAACVTAYTAYLFYNFSGYMDIVIGAGNLLGQALPENFDRPFTARSFLEFWQRWHMTLSEWFKLYLFNPLLFALMGRFPAPGLTASLGVLAFFVTFGVMGVWHGTTLVFVIYGLLMGFGASVNKLWQIACTKRLGKKRYRAMAQRTSYAYLARGLTFAYFALALTCLWVPLLPDFAALAGRLGVAGIGGALLLLTAGFALATLLFDAATSWFRRHAGALRTFSSGLVVRNVSLAACILALLAATSLFNKAPEFVYRAF